MNFQYQHYDDGEEEDDIDQEEELPHADDVNDDYISNDDHDDENEGQEDKDNDDDDDEDDDNDNDDDNENDDEELDHEAHEVIPASDSPRGLFSRRSEIINTLFQKFSDPFSSSLPVQQFSNPFSASLSDGSIKWVPNESQPAQSSVVPSDDGFLAWMREKNRRRMIVPFGNGEKDRIPDKPRSFWQKSRIGSESKEEEENDEDDAVADDNDDDQSDDDQSDEILSEEDDNEDDEDIFKKTISDEDSQHENHNDDNEGKSLGDQTKQSQNDKSTRIDEQPHSSQALLKIDNNSSSSSSSRLSDTAIEEASLLPLKDKLLTFKRFRQTLIHTAAPTAARRFLCEIIYDQVEEEISIKMKYLPEIIGYLFFSKGLTIRFLSRIIDDKEMRVNKVKDIMRILLNQDNGKEIKEKKQKLSQNSITRERKEKKSQNELKQPQRLILEQEKSKELKKSLSSSKDKIFFSCRIMKWLDECKAKSSDLAHQLNILQQLNQRRHSLEGYQNCQVLRDIISDILKSASMQYFNNSKIAQLITPFLLETDISINFFVKCLLKPHKHAIIFSPPARIIVALAQRHKSLLA